MHDFDRRVAELARRQHGVFSIKQIRAFGATAKMTRYRLRTGRWELAHAGIYRLAGAPLTWQGRAMAASLSSEIGAVSHLAAAHLWGLDGFGPVGRVDVTVPRHTRPRPQGGVRFHESLAFDLAAVTTQWGIRVTGPARTVLDVCAAAGRDEMMALAALDEVRRRGLATWAVLWECLILHACRGRNGVVLYRQVLVKRWGKSVPHGKFARLVERLLEDAGLPVPDHEYKIGKYRVDMAFPLWKIAIELDGRDPHAREKAFELDPIRRNWLEVRGWMVLNITWDRLINDPAGIVAELREAIALRSGVQA
jgi:hypothetical protein